MSDTADTSTATQTLGGFMGSAWGSSEDLAGLDSVIGAIADGARQVQAEVQAAAIQGALGTTGETNVHGEMVQQLDSAGIRHIRRRSQAVRKRSGRGERGDRGRRGDRR